MDFKTDISQKEENKGEIKPHDANWLKDLGEQSWQAELVISGLIITALFQLPDVFIKWVETSIIQSGELEYTFFNLASVYVLIGIDLLVIFFGIHLLFRGIWIALLGLNSVYPNGIDTQSENGMGPKFWQKSKEKYPNLTQYCTELDSNCSLIFSMATVTMIIVSSIAIFILLFHKCMQFLISVFPIISDHILAIGIGAYVVFMLVSIILQYLGKKYPDNERIEKIITGYGTVMGTIFSLYIFQKPINYITSIYMSNVKSKRYGFVMLFACVFMGFMGGRHMGNSNAINDFEAQKYFTFNNKPYQILAFNYENLMDKEAQIYTPVIQSDIITDDFVKVFIPNIARERERMNIKEYSIVERFKQSPAEKEAIDKEKFEIYKQFNRIYINDTLLANLEYQFYTHPQATERGLLVYIPSEHFIKGRNILEIRKNYFSKDSIQKIVKIPFFFKKE